MNIDYTKLGERIAKRRRELGLKQYRVCELTDVNYKYLSNLETGRSSPSLEMLMKLCDVLKTTPDYFLLGTDLSGNIPDTLLVEKISRLDNRDRRLIDSMLDVLLDTDR